MSSADRRQAVTPRIEINLSKIAYNAKKLLHLFSTKGIGVMGVTKVVCGSTVIAEVLINQGYRILADSKLENLKKMRDAGIDALFVLLRSPALSEAESVIEYADISMNTELSIIQRLSFFAGKRNTQHKVILMIEMGDLREGIMPADLEGFVHEVRKLPEIVIAGIGSSFACFGGVKPNREKMDLLSSISKHIKTKFSIPLTYVSGGNSANYGWFTTEKEVGEINNLRLGEAIYLGCDPLNRTAIPGLFTDAFTFVSEIIESKIKPSVPYGETGQDAFGNYPVFEDRGSIQRAILGVGAQDVLVSGLSPELDIEILGSSSDHTILDTKKTDLKVGDEVKFSLTYGALLSVMTSPYVFKKYIDINVIKPY
jgi:predicted amino acid racemase